MSPKREERLLLGLPTYGARVEANAEALLKLQQRLAGRVSYYYTNPGGSLLAMNHNLAWTVGLNLRDSDRITHLLMWHSDVAPEDETGAWLETLLDEMARVQADVLGVVLAIKDTRGLTSTALDTDLWRPRRLTATEIMDRPVTWTAPDLLVNTGLLLVDFRQPWVEQVCFTIRDRIHRDPDSGQWRPEVQPEDWDFSRQAHRLGARVFATRAIEARHWGPFPWPGFGPGSTAWGTQHTDETNIEYAQRRVVNDLVVAGH